MAGRTTADKFPINTQRDFSITAATNNDGIIVNDGHSNDGQKPCYGCN